MNRHRERKLREKSQKLQLMEQLLNVQDRMGPEKQLREQMMQEQLLGMVAQREQTLPQELAYRRAQQSALEAETGQRAQLSPLQMQMLQLQNKGLAQDQAQEQALSPIRQRGLEAQVRGTEYQNSPDIRNMDMILKQRQAEGMFEDNKSKVLQRENLRQQIQQGNQLFPTTLEGVQLENATRVGQLTGMGQPMADPMQYLQQRYDLTLPMMPNQQQVNAANAKEMVERLQAWGLMPQDSYLDKLFNRKK